GVLQPKTSYSSKIFEPRVTFQVPNAGWFNEFDGHGELPLVSHDAAGDTVIFLREPRAPDDSVGASIDEIAAWLATFDQVSMTPAKAVKLGGLNGVMMDVAVAPGATAWDPQCPVRVCVPYLHGRDPVVGDAYPWDWDWGVAGPEKERLYLLDASDGTIAVVVDSLDGTTFDSLVGIWEQIVPTIRFG
ncbi:MAG TPA: hypothetical protein VHR16_02545, partial [Candidatus Limnocylindrales bacterium]|nr:hypothetical protein [Candidatus Limnocylindrales bacterium]